MSQERIQGNREVHSIEESKENKQWEGLTFRAVMFSIVVVVLMAIVISRSVYLGGSTPGFDSMTVPSMQGVFCLVVIMGLTRIVPWFKNRLSLKRSELTSVYIIVTAGGIVLGVGLMMNFLFAVMMPQKLAFEDLARFGWYMNSLPSFLLPKSEAAVAGFWLGTEQGVPWGEWILPLIVWFVFVAAILFAFISLTVIVQDQWTRVERLPYPIAMTIVVLSVQDEKGEFLSGVWKSKLLWAGAAVPMIWGITRILNAITPAIPVLPTEVPLFQLASEEPLRGALAFSPALTAQFRPEVIGIGYFIPTDLAFSTWFAFLFVHKLSHVVGALYAGSVWRGWEFNACFGEVGIYLAIGVVLLWSSRHHIMSVIKRAFGNEPASNKSNTNLPMSYDTAVMGGVISFVIVVLFSSQLLHVSLVFSIVYWLLFFFIALTFARVRAEGGAPSTVGAPQLRAPFWHCLGGSKLGVSAMGMSYCDIFLAFGSLCGTTLDGYKMAEESSLKKSSVVKSILIAVVVAYVVGAAIYLPALYNNGGELAQYHWVRSIFEAGQQIGKEGVGPEPVKFAIPAVCLGFIAGLFLMIMRMKFLWWPFHPLGFAIQANTPLSEALWGSFFLVWLIKVLILRYGGGGLYAKLKPLFYGLIIGHTLISIVESIVIFILV